MRRVMMAAGIIGLALVAAVIGTRAEEQVSGMSISLQWAVPPGVTQYQLQVAPYRGDGPGVDLVRNVEAGFVIPPPPQWYGLLPDMSYTWRVRFGTIPGGSDAAAAGLAWSEWTEGAFHTPVRTSGGIRAVAPAGGTVDTVMPVLTWENTDADVFYYEVQLSSDPGFGPDAFLYSALVHGGVSSPPNSYRVPAANPLLAGARYYWRVRPRVQGDGTPVPWSAVFTFAVAGAATTPPSPTGTANPGEGPPAGAMNGLHVSGNRILNGAGQPVQLHGVNRSSFEYACSEGWGISEGPADASEVEAMKAWNINVVRVVLNESCWLGINGVTPAYGGANYQQAVANYVWLLTQHDIAVVINLHFNAPGNTLATDQQPMPDRDHAPAFWASVAARFRDNRAVLFEPYNEPYPDNEGTGTAAWSCWRDGGNCPGVPFVAAGMQELVDAIRGTGAQNIIVATGVNWGSALNHWREYRPNDPAHQLVAGWHSYGDGLSCQTAGCWDTVLAGVLQVAPILATEIGEFDCGHGYIDRVMNWLDSRGQGYLAWSWGPFDCAKDPALLRDWSGTPTQSYGQGFKDHLLSRP